MENAFTPGPWEALCGNECSDHYKLISANVSRNGEGANGGIYVAKVQGPDHIANARLIAAAPELLEALEGIFAHLDDDPGAPGHSHTVPGVWDNDVSNGERAGQPCDWCAHWERARAAIAKARGAHLSTPERE